MAITVDSTTNVIKITGTTSDSTVVYDGIAKVQAIVWQGATTNAHKLSLVNSDDITIYADQMITGNIGANLGVTFPLGLLVKDIYCDDLDSGTVYIYLG